MSTKNSKAVIAKALYLSGHNPERIASILAVTVRTVQGYKAKAQKQGDNWESQRISKHLDHAQKDQESIYADFVEHMYEELRNIRADKKLKTKERIEALSRLGDSFSKMRPVFYQAKYNAMGLLLPPYNDSLTKAYNFLLKLKS